MNKKRGWIFVVLAVLVLSVVFILSAGEEGWVNTGNLSGATHVYSLMNFSGKLYAGTGSSNGDVFVYNETSNTWTNTGDLSGAIRALSLAEFNGKLYSGTQSNGDVFVYNETSNTWTNTGDLSGATVAESLEVFNNKLYAGTGSSNGDVFVYNETSNTWTNTGDLSGAIWVNNLVEFDGKLYAGTLPDGDVFVYNETADTWTNTGDLSGATVAESLEVFNNKLYAGTGNSGDVFVYNETSNTWTNTGDLSGATAARLGVFNNKLYAGTGANGDVFVYNETSNTWTNTCDLSGATAVYNLIEFNGKLYAGTSPNGDVFYYSSDVVAPTYSGATTNNTVAGKSTKFLITIDDGTALEPNGYYIFSTNNTGVWVNNSAVNFTSTPQSIGSTKTLNSTAGVHVGYRWYLYDNASNEAITPIYSITTITTTPTYSNSLYNSTAAGRSTQFSLYVNDETGLEPNGYYIFSTNNTGVWANESIYSYAGMKTDLSLPSQNILGGLDYDGVYIWATEVNERKVYRYYPNMTYSGFNFTLKGGFPDGNLNPRGITQDGTYFWVTNLGYGGASVFKYWVNGTYTGSKINITSSGNANPAGIVNDGTYFWISDYSNSRVYKYWMNGTYTGSSFDTSSSGNTYPFGMSYDGTYFWIVNLPPDLSDPDSRKVFRYYSNGTYSNLNFDVTVGQAFPVGITQIEEYLWVVQYNVTESSIVESIATKYYKYKQFFESTPDTAINTMILNPTVGVHVGYRWYLYDNASNEAITPIYSIITTTTSESTSGTQSSTVGPDGTAEEESVIYVPEALNEDFWTETITLEENNIESSGEIQESEASSFESELLSELAENPDIEFDQVIIASVKANLGEKQRVKVRLKERIYSIGIARIDKEGIIVQIKEDDGKNYIVQEKFKPKKLRYFNKAKYFDVNFDKLKDLGLTLNAVDKNGKVGITADTIYNVPLTEEELQRKETLDKSKKILSIALIFGAVVFLVYRLRKSLKDI